MVQHRFRIVSAFFPVVTVTKKTHVMKIWNVEFGLTLAKPEFSANNNAVVDVFIFCFLGFVFTTLFYAFVQSTLGR